MESENPIKGADSKKQELKLAAQNAFLTYISEKYLPSSAFDEEAGLNAILRCFGEDYVMSEKLIQDLSHIETLNRVCGRGIETNETFFICLDCDLIRSQEINTHFSLQCKECFMSSNHEGHRVATRIADNSNGTCDCGDSSAWDSKGFCPSHPGYTKEIIDQTYEKIPKAIRDCYINSLKEIFYSLFDFLQENPTQGEIIGTIIQTISQLHQLKDCFKLLTSEFLRSKLPESYPLRVNLQNTTTFELLPEASPCDCTFLELLIRFDFMFSKEIQSSIRNLLLELIVFADFKEMYIELFTKLLHFYYNVGNYSTHPKPRFSKNGYNVYQLFVPERCSLTAASSAGSINIISVAKSILNNQQKMSRKKFYAITFYGLGPAKYIFEQQKASEEILRKPEFVDNFFEVIESLGFFESTYAMNVSMFMKSLEDYQTLRDYDYTNFVFKEYLKLVQSIFARIFCIQDYKFRDQLVSSVFKALFFLLEKQMTKAGPIKTDEIRLYPSTRIIFGDFLLLWYRFSKNLEDFNARVGKELQNIGISTEKFEAVAKYVFQSVFILLNYSCAIQRFGEWAPDYISVHYGVEVYFMSRMATGSRIESAFVCLLQLLHNFDRQNDWISSLAEQVCKAKTPHYMIKHEYLPYFFKTGHFILTDEISFNNAILLQNSKKINDSDEFDSVLKAIENKAVLNHLYIFNQESFQNIKSSLEYLLEVKEDSAFAEVTEFDPLTNKLKPKEAFRNKGLDPGIFYLYAPLDNAFKAKVIEDSGEGRTEYQKQGESLNPLIQKKDIGDTVLWTIACAYECAKKSAKNTQLLVPLFEHQIKLLESLPNSEAKKMLEKRLLVPEVEELNKLPEQQEETIPQKESNEEKSYSLKTDLMDVLEILKKNGRGVTESTINNMVSRFSKIIKKVYPTEGEQGLEEEEKIEFRDLVEKKELTKDQILAKQKLIREEFLQKQKKFLNKTTAQDDQQQNSKQTEESNDLGICVACRDPLNDQDHQGYGLISFISKGNIYQHCLAKRSNSQSDLKESYLVLNTCHHMIHIDCYTKIRASSHDSNLYSEVEFSCPLCKTLANQLVYAFDKTSPITQMSKGSESNAIGLSLEDTLKIYEGFSATKEKVENLQQIKLIEELFSNIQVHEVLINQDYNFTESSVDDSFLSLTRALIMAVLETDVIGLQLFLQKRMVLYSVIAQNLRKYAQYKASDEKETSKPPKIIELLKKMYNSKYLSANIEKNLITSNHEDFVRAVWSAFQFVSDENIEEYSKFFLSMLLTNMSLEFMKLFYEDMQTKCNGDTKEMASGFTFDNFKDSCLDNLFCELPNITSMLRKFLALGLITGVYKYSPESSTLADTELSMVQFLLNKSNKKESVALITSFLSQNKVFFEKLLKEIQELDLKIQFEDSNLSGLAPIPLPKNYHEFSTSVSKGKCSICGSISVLLARCLICGEFYCIKTCDGEGMIGNLNLHARNSHFGTSVFISCTDTTIMLVHSPRNVYNGFLYLGKLGQEINQTYSKWEEFTLSEFVYSKIKKMIILGNVPQEIHHLIEMTGQKIPDNII